MGKSHASGSWVETGVRNSQDTARQSVRGLTHWIGPGSTQVFPQATFTYPITRTGVGDYNLSRSGAATGAETDRFVVELEGMFQSSDAADVGQNEQTRGVRINSFEPVYRVLVVNATSMTPTLQTAVYTDGADKAAVVDRPVTPTPLAAGDISFHATNMQRTTISVTTPLILTPAMDATFELTLVLANTGNFEWHGMYVNYDLLL